MHNKGPMRGPTGDGPPTKESHPAPTCWWYTTQGERLGYLAPDGKWFYTEAGAKLGYHDRGWLYTPSGFPIGFLDVDLKLVYDYERKPDAYIS